MQMSEETFNVLKAHWKIHRKHFLLMPHFKNNER